MPFHSLGIFGWLVYFCRIFNRWCLAEFLICLVTSTLLVSRMQLKQLIFKHFCAIVNIVYKHVNRNNVSRTCVEFISYVVHHVFIYACHYIFGWASQIMFSWNWICCCLRKLIFSIFCCLQLCSAFSLSLWCVTEVLWAGNFFENL